MMIVLKLYMIASLVTLILFFVDKEQAKNNAWRISEKHLHLSELLGGWPGAYLAMHLFKHKRQKSTYLTTYYLIVALHLLTWFLIWYL
jgi:uncharacterized membrane protein YsdA (DUF1294 family)